MLKDAIAAIEAAADEDSVRRRSLVARRERMHRLDVFVGQVEDLLEQERRASPPALLHQIEDCLSELNPRLLVLVGPDPGPPQLLDALFQAQEQLLVDQDPPRAISA